MTIIFHELMVTGPGKPLATLKMYGKSHLVFGPTDTGKSYIVECFRYCLGGDQKPKDVGFSEGYTRAALQISLADGNKYTLFRDLFDGSGLVYEGFHSLPPQDGSVPLEKTIGEYVSIWCRSAGIKILVKSGQLGNLTAGDLRRVSIFDEIETLDNAPFEGRDTNLKTRNKSALAVMLSGTDDSEILLPPSTTERNITKGRIEVIDEQITSLLADIPEGLTLPDAQEGLVKVSSEIEGINQYMKSHILELNALKQSRLEIDQEIQSLLKQLSALAEAEGRFRLLERKYTSDEQRLRAVASAASIAAAFDSRPCPLCFTDLQHQLRHQEQNDRVPMLRIAAAAEIEKILYLREGLQGAMSDVLDSIKAASDSLRILEEMANENDKKQSSLLTPRNINLEKGLGAMSERKADLALAVNALSKVESLKIRLVEMKNKNKRKKQTLDRDMSNSATTLCLRVKSLLDNWGVPGVNSIHFNDVESDIEVNQRKRTSYGKGKRGIFLTAYMVALMERAIQNKHPHLGVVVIDSPVVTYKDPKYAEDKDVDELLDESVKNRFYAWLASRPEYGQIIILENEEPSPETLSQLSFTEFFGANSSNGRAGFFPKHKI